MSTVFSKQNTAVITGGGSGIGLALVKKCVGHGMRVLVADWDEKGLEAARSAGADAVQMDVGKFEDWAGLKDRVLKDFGGQLNLLALNAGMGARTSFTDPDPTIFQKVVQTNLFGVINGLTSLLPLIQNQNQNQSATNTTTSTTSIIITGSKQGITNPPGNPGYNISKSAVKTLAEQLSHDLAKSSPSTSVHFLVPGWTWTPLAGAAEGRQKHPSAWTPEQVVDYLAEKMAQGKFWVLCPDNDVSEDMDRRRMLWSADDAILGRPPLSRWREECKEEFEEWMEKK